MSQRNVVTYALSIAAFAAAASVGCNGLLGNEEGKPRSSLLLADAGGDPDGGPPDVRCEAATGDKLCYGLCVKIDQPNTGCGGDGCTACDPKNVGAATCKGGASTLVCAFDACKAGFENCDQDPANGCEASLNSRATCGDCSTRCRAPTPVCAPTSEGGFACAAGCPPGTEDCDGACVDTQISVEHCGQCRFKCERTSATATCSAGVCQFECQRGTHACGDRCVQDANPKQCGPQCVECQAAGPNTVPTCQMGNCGYRCAEGFRDCNGNGSGKDADGCERQGSLCPLILPCGGLCSKDQKCCNGSCKSNLFECPPVER